MNEDFVTIEIAKKLHENGFNEPCINAINPYGCTYLNGWCEYLDNRDGEYITQQDLKAGCYLLPTISQVLKWLRNEKKIYVSILPFATHSTINKVAFYYLIEYNSTGETMEGIEQNTYCAEWKDAAFAGIEYVLDNLI